MTARHEEWDHIGGSVTMWGTTMPSADIYSPWAPSLPLDGPRTCRGCGADLEPGRCSYCGRVNQWV